MKDENTRNLYLKVRVSQAEMDAIKKKFENSGMSSLSGFVRAMIFEWYIVHMDENELHNIFKLATNIANNINQIAVRVNSTRNIYESDIAEIRDGVNKLWQPLNFLQGKVLQLKRWAEYDDRRQDNFRQHPKLMCALCTGLVFENAAHFTKMVTIIQ